MTNVVMDFNVFILNNTLTMHIILIVNFFCITNLRLFFYCIHIGFHEIYVVCFYSLIPAVVV